MSILYKNKNNNTVESIFSTSNISSSNILNLNQGLQIGSINLSNAYVTYELNVAGNINFTGDLFKNDIPFSSPISANIANIYKYLFSEPLFIGANVIPRINNVYNLGNITNTWGSLYIGNSKISSDRENLVVNSSINILGNIYQNGRIFQGPTGPTGIITKALPTASYYLSSNINVISGQMTLVKYDTADFINSSGTGDFIYDITNGILTNPTNETMTISLSGQIQTSNNSFDVLHNQPIIYVVKNNNNILSSSVLNYQGSSFSTTIVLNPNDQVKIMFIQYFNTNIYIDSGQYTTRITFTQLNNILSYTGYTGSTGPAGVAFSVPMYSYYLSTDIPIYPNQNTTIIFDTFDNINSTGNADFQYNPLNGILTNTTIETIAILISGQLQTDNDSLDLTENQPIIFVLKNNQNIISSSVLNYQGSSFSTTLVLYPNDQVKINFEQFFNHLINVKGGQFTTRISFTQLNNYVARTGDTGCTGMTGPAGTDLALPSVSYYLSSNINILPLEDKIIKYDTIDMINSNGDTTFVYNTVNGILTNPTSTIISVLISGQIQTDNTILDITLNQPLINILKNGNNIISSSVLNYKGSSFSATVVLYPYDEVYITYKQYFNSSINVLKGKYITRITYTQLNNVIMKPGNTGPTGPAGISLALPSVSYYLSTNQTVIPLQSSVVIYDTLDLINSSGLQTTGFIYDTLTGILVNTSTNVITILVSGQLTTNNEILDVTENQPVIYVVKNNDKIISSSILNYQGSSFSTTLVLLPNDTVKIMFMQYSSNSVSIISGQFNTRITYTQLNNTVMKPGDTGSTGYTGPAGTSLALPSISYYLSSNINILPNQNTYIIYNTLDTINSNGISNLFYDVITGHLTNPTVNVVSILISGQLTTDNTILDITLNQPLINILKNGNNIISSSVLNYKGSSFSTLIVMNPNDIVQISFTQYFNNSINVLSGQYTTRITYTQLNNVLIKPGDTGSKGDTGPSGLKGDTGLPGVNGTAVNTGATGPTGINGAIGVTGPTGYKGSTGLKGDTGPVGESFNFDGGTPFINYIIGPTFNCGGVL